MNHVILGAGGSIGNALANELIKSKEKVRLVSRRKISMIGAESFQADISVFSETLNAVQNADLVYLCVGLPYNSEIWRVMWPKIMKNSIDACKSVNAKLIFFDNAYMYGKSAKMTESSAYNPCSIKGEIRANLAIMLEDEIKNKNIKALIARSADLYGPYALQTSFPYFMVFEKMLNGKKANWLVDDEKPHTFSYTLDCAKALTLLSKDDECFQQVWHLPSYNPALTGKEFIRLTAKELNVPAEYTIMKKWFIHMGGIFNKSVSEVYEMLYQNENEYYFDSTKFNEYFNYKPTTYEAGIKETLNFLKK